MKNKKYILTMVVIDHKGDVETTVFKPFDQKERLDADLQYMIKDTLEDANRRGLVIDKHKIGKYKTEIAYHHPETDFYTTRWIWEIHTVTI